MSSKRVLPSEADLAHVVVVWLTNQGYVVYQEVTCRGGIADIVGRAGTKLCVVECKTSLGLRVINQAENWVGLAHLVYVAVPMYGGGRDGAFAARVAGLFGLGVLRVSVGDTYIEGHVDEIVRPHVYRRIAGNLREVLAEGHQTFAPAGNAQGKRWTPFQETCRAITAYAGAHPGCTLKDLVDNVKTHYRAPTTARACIVKYVESGVIDTIRLERLGRLIRVWPDGVKIV